MDGDGGGESNDNNATNKWKGMKKMITANSIDQDNRSEEDDDDDVSDDDSVDMAEEIIDEIDEQLNSDELKHFMLHFHKGIYMTMSLKRQLKLTNFKVHTTFGRQSIC